MGSDYQKSQFSVDYVAILHRIIQNHAVTSKILYAALQVNVELAKSNVGMLGKCKTKNCCWMLRIKKKAWLALATARSIINNTCFRGGDATHQDEEAKAWAKVSECEQIIAMECND